MWTTNYTSHLQSCRSFSTTERLRVMLVQVLYGLLVFESFTKFSTCTEIDLPVKSVNPLDGKHLRIHAMEFPVSMVLKRNSTGHVIYCTGVMCEYIKVLSETLNFSYSFLPVKENFLENMATGGGAIYFLIRDEADYLLSSSLATPFRNQVVDLPTNWFDGLYGFIVPYPSGAIDFMSTLKIFSYQAWIAIFSSIIAMLIYLRFTSLKIFRTMRSRRVAVPSSETSLARDGDASGGVTSFVLGNIVSQGQHCSSKRLVVRIAAGSWCLACFFFVQMYSTTLTSHLMKPNQKPIANTMRELANDPGLALTLDFGYGFHQELKTLLQFDDFKKLSDKIKKARQVKCNTTEACLKRIREDGNVAYSSPPNPLKIIMNNDLKSTGKCHYYLLKDTVLYNPVYNFLQKRSPYTERINVEILRLKEAGLINKWTSDVVPNPRKCMELDTQGNSDLKRLSLSNLSSAFVILGIGIAISLLVFLLEKIFHFSP